jgi:hypothetical protein
LRSLRTSVGKDEATLICHDTGAYDPHKDPLRTQGHPAWRR